MDRRRAAGKINPELPHLKALRESAPRTKSGRIVWAWPEIQASLAGGRKMHEIWEALQLDGIEMSYGQFRTYVSRIRKKGVPAPVSAGEAAMLTSPGSGAGIVPPRAVAPAPHLRVNVSDPLANTREAERKRVVFDYRPELADPSKLI
jgi:hypothetical protein